MLYTYEHVPQRSGVSSPKELEKRIDSINELLDRIKKLETQIKYEIATNVTVNTDGSDLERQPVKFSEEEFKTLSSQ